MFQLAAKVLGAVCRARVARRVVECQGGQRIDHTEIAHLLAIDGFHADDADDVLRRHSIGLLGARQCGLVFVPEAQACADADGLDKAAAVGAPVFHSGRTCARGHQALHRGVEARLVQAGAQPRLVDVAASGYFAHKGVCLRAASIRLR